MTCTVVASDERSVADSVLDVDRWARLAEVASAHEGGVGELTLTFLDRSEMAELNAEHMGKEGATDVLSFPMDDVPTPGVPTLLGDIVICPAVAADQFATHAGTFDDEVALLVVHGVLHILGHDHAEAEETVTMRSRELALLEHYHWDGPAPDGFRQAQD
jgi:probable rRNA maturation factor